VARQVRELLEGSAAVTVWDSGVFKLTQSALESLLGSLPTFDFAILVLTPDDVAIRRGSSFRVARDNVLFELGLFLGSFGQRRTFVICSREVLRSIPSDLWGITFAMYQEPGPEDVGGLHRALRPAARQIRNALQPQVDRYEVDFLKAYLTFIRPPVTLVETYSQIIAAQYEGIRRAVGELEQRQDWAALLAVKERLGEYFEYQGKYIEGIEFGKLYARALERQGKTSEALWFKVKRIAYLLILAGDCVNGRRMIDHALRSLSKLPATSSVRECCFYCYRYKGIAYMRDQVTHTKSYRLKKAEECFAKAEQVVGTFVHSRDKFRELRGRVLGNWGNLAQEESDYITATSCYVQSLRLFRRLDDKEHIGIALLQMSQARISGSFDLDIVEADLDYAESIFVDIGWIEGQGRVLHQRARLYEKLAQKVDLAKTREDYLHTCARYARVARQRFESVNAQRLAGQVSELLGRLPSTAAGAQTL